MDSKLVSALKTYNKPDKSNTKYIGKELSEDSFIEYNAFRLKDARVVWFNHRYFSERGIDTDDAERLILENYAYVAGGYVENDRIDWEDKKCFVADRYGCHAPISNGGSSRCGSNGEFQIKGNGINGLVGMNIDEGHSNGKLCLAEAVAEAIWGEVCNSNLPQGAIRTIAIIDTKELFESEHGLGERKEQPAAIAVREWCIRPAHYERAVYFWPYPEYQYLRDSDHHCVKNAVELYHKRCAANGTTVYDSLKENLESIADQVAASRIRGIPHGSLSSSNIGLDGTFLDFGTITAVPDFDNYLLSGGMGATWDDHKGISSWLRSVLFYFEKYGSDEIGSPDIKALIQRFREYLFERENYYTALECGLDVEPTLTESDLISFGEKIKNRLREGKTSEKMMTKFDIETFRNDVEKAIFSLGISKYDIRFPLRKMFFTKFEMVTNPLLTDPDVCPVALQELIESYASASQSISGEYK
jgi:hypothetical protein